MKKLAVVVVFAVLSVASFAQSIPGITLPGAQSQAAVAYDPLGRDTPYGTVTGFLQAAQNGNTRAAADYLQMSPARRQAQGAELAKQLKALMDRDFEGSLRRLSTRPEGSPEAGGPDQQIIGTFSSGEAEVPVVLVRIAPANAAKIWVFSQDTLAKVPDLYDNLQAQRIEKDLPHELVGTTFLGLPLWQWLALLVAVPVAAGIGWIVVQVLAVPRTLWLKVRKRPSLFLFNRVSPPLWLTFSAIAHRVIASYLRLPLLPRLYYYRTIGVVILVGFFWFVLRAAGITMQRLRAHAIGAGRIGTGTLMLLGERLLKALVWIIAVLAVLSVIGFNLTTVLAGLGIGGLAIAFAAQKTLENLFGGVSLLGDEVIRVGDFCRFGDKVGTVEDISLRSTRIRTVDRSELSIPNGSLATMSIENLARRDKILFNPSIGVRYETTPDQLRYLLAELRRMLYEHPKIESQSARIRLASLDNNALTLEIFSYVLTRDFAEFTAIREDLLLRIMEIVEKSGSGFAFPSRTVYLNRDPSLDNEKAVVAESQVQKWREEQNLPFPDFAPEDVSSFRGSIAYPAPESATGGDHR